MSRFPSPPEMGLPEKFTSWRTKQMDLLDVIITSRKRGKRAVAGCSPTGGGKSLAVVAAAVLSGEPTCIVTSTRGLQSQYLDDFRSIGMVDIRGRSNYPCQLREDYTCEDGYAARCPYKGSVGCPSSKAEMAMSTAMLGVTNYSKWIAERRWGNVMGHFTQVVFDEAHHMVEAVAHAMHIDLNHKEIESDLGIDFLTGASATSFPDWKRWAFMARGACDLMVRDSWNRINGVTQPKPSWVKHFIHMRTLLKKLQILSTGRPDNWIVEETEKGFEFDPIRLGPYAEGVLLVKVPRIIAVSGNLRPKSLFMVGLGRDSFEFHEFDSDFDPRRCPIYYVPTMRVDNRNLDNMPYLWLLLDQIASRRRDRKGMVGTVSFARQQDIIGASKFWESMIVNERGEPPDKILDQFYKSGPGSILVSPSYGEGYDFKDDLCRWAFLAKVPFDPPSNIVKAREAADPEYRAHRAVQKICQFYGRIIRSKSDWGEGFIGDRHLDWFWPRYRHLAPRSFHQFFRPVDTVPAPLSL